MNNKDQEVMETIKKIIDKGNSAEVKKNKDGSYKVFEVKKNIAIG